MLPDILAAVGETIEVHMDGGIRSELDATMALCGEKRVENLGRHYLPGPHGPNSAPD